MIRTRMGAQDRTAADQVLAALGSVCGITEDVLSWNNDIMNTP